MELPQNDGDSLDKLLEEYIQSIDSSTQFNDNGWFINNTQSAIITSFSGEEGQDLLEEMLGKSTNFNEDQGCHSHNPPFDFIDDTFFPETIEFPINQLEEQDLIFGPSQGDLSLNMNATVKEIEGVVGKEISMDNHGGENSILANPADQIVSPPSPIVPMRLPLASSNTAADNSMNSVAVAKPPALTTTTMGGAREKPARRGRYSLEEFAKLKAEDPEKANKLLENRKLAYKEKERKKFDAIILEKDLKKVETEASQLASKLDAMQIENKNLCVEGAKVKQHRTCLENQLAHQDDVIDKVKTKLSYLMAVAPSAVRGRRNHAGIQVLQDEVHQIEQLMEQFFVIKDYGKQASQQCLVANGNQNFMVNNVQLRDQHQPGLILRPPPMQHQPLLPSHQQQHINDNFLAVGGASSSLHHSPTTAMATASFSLPPATTMAASSSLSNNLNLGSPYYITFP